MLEKDYPFGAGIAAVALIQSLLNLLVRRRIIEQAEMLELIDMTLQSLEQLQAGVEASQGSTEFASHLKSARFQLQTMRITAEHRNPPTRPTN